MASSKIMLFSAFDPSQLKFSGLEKNKKGGKVVFLGIPDALTGERQRVTIQTPALALPFGVSPYQEATTGEIQSYSLDVSFRGHDTNPAMGDFMARMRALDEVLMSAAVTESKEWFGKKMSREIVAEFFRKLVKDPSNPKYAPVMKVKVPLANGEPAALFFDEQRRPTTIDYLVKGCTVKLLMEIDRVWFVNKNFGVTWRLLQAAVISRPERLDSYSFLDDDGDMPLGAEDDSMPAPLEM